MKTQADLPQPYYQCGIGKNQMRRAALPQGHGLSTTVQIQTITGKVVAIADGDTVIRSKKDRYCRTVGMVTFDGSDINLV